MKMLRKVLEGCQGVMAANSNGVQLTEADIRPARQGCWGALKVMDAVASRGQCEVNQKSNEPDCTYSALRHMLCAPLRRCSAQESIA